MVLMSVVFCRKLLGSLQTQHPVTTPPAKLQVGGPLSTFWKRKQWSLRQGAGRGGVRAQEGLSAVCEALSLFSVNKHRQQPRQLSLTFLGRRPTPKEPAQVFASIHA